MFEDEKGEWRPASIVVAARNGSDVIYWEGVEDGFNVSPISADGQVLEHRCNQDGLGFALNGWIEGRSEAVGGVKYVGGGIPP